jgi:hypothetical protein
MWQAPTLGLNPGYEAIGDSRSITRRRRGFRAALKQGYEHFSRRNRT